MQFRIFAVILTFCMAAAAQRDPWAIPPPREVSAPWFPASSTQLELARDQGEYRTLREHAWRLLELVTRPAGTGSRIPAWLSWCTRQGTFNGSCSTGRSEQFLRGFESVKTRPNLPDDFKGSRDFSTVHFNPAAAARFQSGLISSADKPVIPLSQVSGSYDRFAKTLQKRPIEDQRIDEFPAGAIIVKPIWLLIQHPDNGDLRQVPVWDGLARNRSKLQNGKLSMWGFARRANVTLSANTLGCDGKPLGRDKSKPGDVPIERFYFYPICHEEQNTEINQLPDMLSRAESKINDYLVLAGVHIITKETKDWVWTTFWWHDAPNEGPYGADRPLSLRLSVWGNYRMDVALDAERPIYNPYLELGFQEGANSNCLGCHQAATLPRREPPPLEFRQGQLPDNSPLFQNCIRTDFLWSIAREYELAKSPMSGPGCALP